MGVLIVPSAGMDHKSLFWYLVVAFMPFLVSSHGFLRKYLILSLYNDFFFNFIACVVGSYLELLNDKDSLVLFLVLVGISSVFLSWLFDIDTL